MKLKDCLIKGINNYEDSALYFKNKYKSSLNSDPYESILNIDIKEFFTPISIVIPCWNTSDIIYTLKSIELSTFNKKFHNLLEVVIVDDGSDYSVKELIHNKNFYLNIKLIRQKHLGRAYAINTGVFYASNEQIIFCDSDIILSPTTIEQLAIRSTFVDNAILFGFRNDIDRPLSENDFLTFFNEPPKFYEDNRFKYDFDNSWSTNMMQETNFLQNYKLKNNFWVSDEKNSIDDCWQSYRMVYGFLFTTTKTMFNFLGGFDERLSGWGWDDSIYCARALSQNISIIPITSAHCLHIKHNYRTKDQWGECAKNFKIVRKNLNSNKILHFNEINRGRVEEIINFCKGEKPKFIYNFKENIQKVRSVAIENFRYFYILANYATAISYVENVDELQEEDLNNYIDCLIRLNKQDLFNKLQKERCLNCFNYYIGEIFFNNNFNLIIPQNSPSKNFIYLYKIPSLQHCKRGKAFYKQKMFYMALKDFCASYLLGNKCIKKYIIKTKREL